MNKILVSWVHIENKAVRNAIFITDLLPSIQVRGKLKEHMNITRLSAVVLFTGRMHKN
jgi:hypothetical protein